MYGVAGGGGTTAIIMQCMELLDAPYELHSIDLAEQFYRAPEHATGYLADEAKKFLKAPHQKAYLGKLAHERMGEIGGDVDFLVLDTVHSLPGELLDFLALLPYLKDGAIVVLHDLVNNFRPAARTIYTDMATATKYLFDSVTSEEKYLMRDDSRSDRGCFPNIGAFRISQATRRDLAAVASALSHTWNYLPLRDQLASYRAAITKSLDEEGMRIFDSVCTLNHAILIAPRHISIREFLSPYKRRVLGVKER